MTNILVLPVYGFDVAAGNNEDLNQSYAYVDDQVVSVTIFNGGTATGGTGFSGTLPAFFAVPASGVGRPALGIATIVGGVLQSIAINDPGAGYEAAEQVGLSIPGADPSITVAVLVGNAISFTGIIIDFEVRPAAGGNIVLLSASTQANINGLPTNGTIAIYNNVMTILFPERAMKSVGAGSYLFEARAYADGVTRVIAKGNLVVSQGVAFERG